MAEEFETCPEYEPATFNEGGEVQPAATGLPRWAGKNAPPLVGTKIHVTMNNLGVATVTGFFVEEGFLGLKVRFHDAPEWHRKQNRGNPNGYIFGPEFKDYEPCL
jgi:hypothetical protein